MLFPHSFRHSLHLAPRHFNGTRILAIGYIPHKEEVMDRTFDTFNYSLILSGTGFYGRKGGIMPLAPPCVITQQPGIPVRYGPAPFKHWEELYFIFEAGSLKTLADKGLLGKESWMWPIRNIEAVRRALRELKAAMDSAGSHPGDYDRIDLLVERVLMETLLPGRSKGDPESLAVADAIRTIHASPAALCDFVKIAREHGLSYSTFQRRWKNFYKDSPGQYQLNFRISTSCRLLTETSLPILEIARQTGFEDPAYFSRLFHARIGAAPSDYRELHKEKS